MNTKCALSGKIYNRKGEKMKKSMALICAAVITLAGCSEADVTPNSEQSGNDSQFITPTDPGDNTGDKSSEPTDENITVSADEPLVINDDITCKEGNEIRIEKGGTLTLGGDLDLSGDLYVEGKLIIEEDATISGPGILHVVNSFDDIDCKGTVTAKIDAPEPVEVDGVTYVGGVLLVNKEYSLPREFGTDIGDIRPELKQAIEHMRADTGFGMTLRASSGYRSYATQEWWFNYYCETDGYENAITYSALPGHSEHQSGYAADITRTELDYADTEEGKWLAANCYKYGCIIRYPADKVDITGYIYEPWHIRYLGKSTAKLVHDSGLCLEEFLEVD